MDMRAGPELRYDTPIQYSSVPLSTSSSRRSAFIALSSPPKAYRNAPRRLEFRILKRGLRN
ncbi:hypothetical protein [Oryza sativa Japonica Group]|uniref:Uncharacterized protein n=1 Tax=Oryza sativa subsp. japonica TaxID=39947 RepID=Q5NBG4_ORYSJ|nr:hypothetical protein [Oryza sativa Japonica Group]